ncbi:MAG: ATP-binding cassette domain-containing protein [Myxococcaceae bacterium]|jgi:phospholipid/cholesterol/gamma-HCH transport system ATP-binding protein|nr:ATP-binding cassette domain-containing protein [Myxococcaceae bacterium]
MTPAIELRDVHKAFGDLRVLEGVSLAVSPGETFVLLGRSGAGKTVVLKLIEGLLRPDAGQVLLEGHDLSTVKAKELLELRGLLGIQFQSGALFDSMTVFDNVAFPLRERHLLPTAKDIEARVCETLALVGLSEAANELPAALSGGMRTRLAFARAYGVRPRILLCDNPTAGLDPLLTEAVDDALAAGKRSLGATIVLVTNSLPTAFRLGDRLALLHEGRLVEVAPPEAFKRSTHPAVTAFLHDWLERRRA